MQLFFSIFGSDALQSVSIIKSNLGEDRVRPHAKVLPPKVLFRRQKKLLQHNYLRLSVLKRDISFKRCDFFRQTVKEVFITRYRMQTSWYHFSINCLWRKRTLKP